MIKTGWRVALLLVVIVAAAAVVTADSARVAPTSPPPARPASPQAMVAGALRTIDVTVSDRYVSMPSTLAAGTYIFRVTTTDKHATVQAYRPGFGLTRPDFLARVTRGRVAYADEQDVLRPYDTFVRSGEFLGGATATPDTVGMFAQTLSAGEYWFYEDAYWGPTHVAKTKIVTVTGGLSPLRPMPIAGDVTYRNLKVQLPAHLPRTGWLRITASGPLWRSWIVRRVGPRTASDVECSGYKPVCAFDLTVLEDAIGALVSPGQSVLWHYDLPPADYVINDIAPTQYYDDGLGEFAGDPGVATRFTVS